MSLNISQKFAQLPAWKRAAMVIPVGVVLLLILFGHRIFGGGTVLPPAFPKPSLSVQHQPATPRNPDYH